MARRINQIDRLKSAINFVEALHMLDILNIHICAEKLTIFGTDHMVDEYKQSFKDYHREGTDEYWFYGFKITFIVFPENYFNRCQ